MERTEAINIIRSHYPANKQMLNEALETLIPELKESEDEKIRKTLINFFRSDYQILKGLTNPDIVAWLEKQGEQKSNSEEEPKFKVGDWIVNRENKVGQIKEVKKNFDGERYCVEWLTCTTTNPLTAFADDNFRPWTIQDAKDGDVLSFGGWVGIFEGKEYTHNEYSFHCSIDENGDFDTYETWKCNDADTHPATKEQRDLLFSKMKEAGYEWDAEKKELKKIEQKSVEDYDIDGLFHAKTILEKTLGKVEGYQTDDGILEHKAAITAVQMLREQKPAEWGEEDEDVRQSIIVDIEARLKTCTHTLDEYYTKQVDWLKSLSPQNHWKPTDEQIDALIKVSNECNNNEIAYYLIKLIDDLKKLQS